MLHIRKEIYTFFIRLRSSSPLVFGLLVGWLVLELVFALALPALIGDTQYFAWYVPDKAKQSTARFLRDENANIPDPIAGWRNKPNVHLGKWVVDANGSRSSHPVDLHHKGAPTRVVFFGSSMVNGGEGVDNQHTISAGIESDRIESLNFASMAFSLDQSLLLYREMANQLQADVVVVGLDSDPIDGLYNHYIPLMLHDEVGVPYLKPRFRLDNGSLDLVPIDLKWLADLDHAPQFVSFLQQNDRHYEKLIEYKHCDFTPLAHGACWLHDKVTSTMNYLNGGKLATDPLMEAEMAQFQKEVSAHGAKLIFMVLPNARMFYWSGYWKYFPDVYALRIKALRDKGFAILDVRDLFRKSGLDGDALFWDDQHHFAAPGNRVAAAGLLKMIQAEH